MNSHRLSLAAMPAVFVLIWSSGFIVARFGMPYAAPFTFLAWRYAFSILCLLIWIFAAGIEWPRTRQQWLHLSVTGLLMHAGYLGCVWSAVKAGMGASLVSLIVGLQPVLTALWLSLRNHVHGRVTKLQWVGLLLGLIGLVLVVWRKLTQGNPFDHADSLNLSFAFVALLCITVGTLYQKRHLEPCDVRTANAVQLMAALAATLPLAWLEAESTQWTTPLLLAMGWSVVGLTIGASSLLFIMIQRGASASVASLMYLIPPTTAIMAWALFDEAITALTLLGIAVTAAGVGLVLRRPASA